MKYIKLYEDWHVMPDGKLKEVYCHSHDLVFNMFDWLNKLIEKEPAYEPFITKFKKDLDRGFIDPHDFVDNDVMFFTEEEVLDYLEDIVFDYNNKKGRK